jgi:putative peptide zinc metalloprotease protein
LVWWAVTPGTLVSDVAFAAVIIGGITTVFMNINPLIPLDGYYALSDYLEVPNLRQRAFGYLSWLMKSRVLRLDVPRPAADEREQRIFLIYSALGAIYIALILVFCAANTYGWLSRTLGAIGVVVFLVGAAMVLRRQFAGWGNTMALALRQHLPAWKAGRMGRRMVGVGAAIAVLGALVPWPITIAGRFAVAPALAIPLTASDSGFVEQVNVREGTEVPAGSLLLRIRNLELERQAASTRRSSDSLAIRSAQARAAQQLAEIAQIDAARSIEQARLAGLQERIEALGVRALASGVVVTPRPEELSGRWVSRGQVVLTLGQPDSVEVRIALSGPGATAVQVGQPVRLLSSASLGPSLGARLGQVSSAANSHQSLEARVRLQGSDSWRPGMTGRARITLRRSNLWGALWWTVRRQIRSDILL